MSELGERWQRVRRWSGDPATEVGDAMVRRMGALEVFVDWVALGHGPYRSSEAILDQAEAWARRLRDGREDAA